MSVVNVKAEWSTAAAPIDLASGSSATLSWTVLLDGRDSVERAAIIARQAPGIPRVGQRHPADPTAICRSVDPKPISPAFWRVTASYYSPAGGTGKDGEPLNPLDQPPEIHWGFEQIVQQVDTDIDGKAIVNSAGEAFDPPPEMPFRRPVLSVTRNERKFPGALARAYAGGRGAVNSGTFYGWPPKTALCRNISGDDQRAGDVIYSRVTYEIAFDGDGWQPKYLDVGFNEVEDGELKRIMTDDEPPVPVSSPAALSGGKAKAPGATVDRVGPFKLHPELSFAALHL